ncbi:hypothetical protein [Phyllobacterium sp. YR531]|uniref:hypothetical protein n=1 Tax=Phyllobacterium sp. YR531 TaxID=1144343 RepID=UPI00026F903F|nr:hypothetical protein [Phyllobacterium sp. YR531]EJN01422.1 hypothetical protein PMI41_03504 [Phyllobacterium sp. YR531]
MTNEKSWFASKTIWASIATIGLSCSGFLSGTLESVDQASISETMIEFLTAISGVVALFGRISATTLISRKEI